MSDDSVPRASSKDEIEEVTRLRINEYIDRRISRKYGVYFSWGVFTLLLANFSVLYGVYNSVYNHMTKAINDTVDRHVSRKVDDSTRDLSGLVEENVRDRVSQSLDEKLPEAIAAKVNSKSVEVAETIERNITRTTEEKIYRTVEDQIRRSLEPVEIRINEKIEDQISKSIGERSSVIDRNIGDLTTRVVESSARLDAVNQDVGRLKEAGDSFNKLREDIGRQSRELAESISEANVRLEDIQANLIDSEERAGEYKSILDSGIKSAKSRINSLQTEINDKVNEVEVSLQNLSLERGELERKMAEMAGQLEGLQSSEVQKLAKYVEIVQSDANAENILSMSANIQKYNEEILKAKYDISSINSRSSTNNVKINTLSQLVNDGLDRVRNLEAAGDALERRLESNDASLREHEGDLKSIKESLFPNIVAWGTSNNWEVCPEVQCKSSVDQAVRVKIYFDRKKYGSYPLFLTSVSGRNAMFALDGMASSYFFDEDYFVVILRWDGVDDKGNPVMLKMDPETVREKWKLRVNYVIIPNKP